MKKKIIFFDDFKNIKIDKLMGIKEAGYSRCYKKFQDDVIEIISSIDIEIIHLKKLIVNNNGYKNVLVLKEINESNINLLKSLYNDSVIVAAASIKLSDSYFNDDYELLKNVIYFPQLLDENNFIDLELFIFAIKNRIVNINDRPVYILFGKEEEEKACGSIPVFILSRFEKIQKLKQFNLELYNQNTMNIEEVAYVEDCIREYIKDNSTFTIEQIENSFDKRSTYFLLCAQ